MNITAAMVKELRDRTGAGMMECKTALVDADGDMADAEDSPVGAIDKLNARRQEALPRHTENASGGPARLVVDHRAAQDQRGRIARPAARVRRHIRFSE